MGKSVKKKKHAVDTEAEEEEKKSLLPGRTKVNKKPKPPKSSDESEAMEWEEVLRSLPYQNWMEQCLPFQDPSLRRLIPGCELKLTIQDVCLEDKCWYTLELEHGPFTWSIKKRFRDFFQLHHQLQVRRTLLKIKLPEIKKERDPKTRKSSISLKSAKVPDVPTFPLATDVISRKKDIQWKMAAFESYTQQLLMVSKWREFPATLEFLEIGPLSFVGELGPAEKAKEGWISRRWNTNDGCMARLCISQLSMWCPSWKKRWMFIKENFFGMIDPKSGDLESVLLFDRAFKVSKGKFRTGSKKGLRVENLNRTLFLKCSSEAEAENWAIELEFVKDKRAADFVQQNRYASFAPPRPSSECKWIVDGATYFEAVAEALDKAKEEIFIADWWLSPEVYLKRPTVHGHYWQLDYLLKRKAMAGVRVYVLLYREVEMALGLNSHHSKQRLLRMHKNIQVLRHPAKGVFLWAHHEKIVCVDQCYAFVGGIDLCYGRWDDYQHRLSDLGEIENKLKVLHHMTASTNPKPGPLPNKRISASNPDISAAAKKKKNKANQQKEENQKVKKTARFKATVKKAEAAKIFGNIQRKLSMEAKGEVSSNSDLIFEPAQLADRRRTMQEMALLVLGMDQKFRLWHGKDYANFITKDFYNLDKPYTDNVDRNVTPRMPWHDVGLFVQGRVARDVARHFILRWNIAKNELYPNEKTLQYLLPKAYSNFGDNVTSVLHDTIGSIHRAECQVLRSLSYWSGHVTETECSILNAYIDVIRNSKHFIYIENQFFISQPAGENCVFNGIADALYLRIVKAHRERTPFHVFVVLPLLPAFEGELGTGSGACIQAITHWNYKSICRGPTSLVYRLSRQVEDPSLYISFYGLRTHGTLNTKLVTELVYVHSKLLLADDQVAIIGSANLNDRSMLGRRDSEMAIMVRDTHFLAKEKGRPHQAGRFAHSLRTALFREHLGLMDGTAPFADIRDPSSEIFVREVWGKTAKNNTDIYEEVFRCMPTNSIRNFKQMKKYLSEPCLATTNPNLAKEKLKRIKGYLVMFPFEFLSGINFATTFTYKEHYLPASVWT